MFASSIRVILLARSSRLWGKKPKNSDLCERVRVPLKGIDLNFIQVRTENKWLYFKVIEVIKINKFMCFIFFKYVLFSWVNLNIPPLQLIRLLNPILIRCITNVSATLNQCKNKQDFPLAAGRTTWGWLMQFWVSLNYLISFRVYFAMQLLLLRRTEQVRQRVFGTERFFFFNQSTLPRPPAGLHLAQQVCLFQAKANSPAMYAFIFSICWNHCLNIFTLYHSIWELGNPVQRETLISAWEQAPSQSRVGGPKSSPCSSLLWILFLVHFLAFLWIYAFRLHSSLHAYIHILVSLCVCSPVSGQQSFMITFWKQKKWSVIAAGGCIIEGLYQHLWSLVWG